MSEHLRTLSKHAWIPLSVMPNAGLLRNTRRGAPPTRTSWPRRWPPSSATTGCGWSAAAARRPRTSARVADAIPSVTPAVPHPRPEPGVSLLYAAVLFRQDTSVLMVGERTNANGSKIFREAMLAERWEDCVAMREQIRDGALIDLNIDYVGRDGAADMAELADGWPRRPPC